MTDTKNDLREKKNHTIIIIIINHKDKLIHIYNI